MHAVIDTSGHLSEFKNTSSVITAIICAEAEPEPFNSKQYKAIYQNDDDSVTIVAPRFDYMGTPSLIDYDHSDATGVCKLFGYSGAITSTHTKYTHIPDSVKRMLPVIGASGKLNYIANSRAEFDTIVCVN